MSAPRAAAPRVPSLLATLLADPLDPGYAAAAARRGRPGGPGPRSRGAWTLLGVLVVGLVLGVAAATASAGALAGDQVRTGLAGEARAAQARNDALATDRDALAAAAVAERARVLDGGAEGRAANADLQELQVAAAATAVVGPGLQVTLSDTGDATGARGGTVLDRDLALVVNALWAAGAEAIDVGGVRLSPQATIRQAGGAMLVDDQPVSSPYTVSAIGPTDGLETGFVRSEAYVRLSAVSQVYGVGFAVAAADRLELPAASGADPSAPGTDLPATGGGR